MDEDGIDKTQWLPDGAEVVNEYRLAKPDISIDRLCDSCKGSGEAESSQCRKCNGRGRTVSGWRGNEIDPPSGIKWAKVTQKNILIFLHEKHLITDQHAHDARTYEIWYEIFKATATMGKKPMYGSARGELTNEGLSEYGFVLLIEVMPLVYHDIIKYMIYTLQTDSSRSAARLHQKTYRVALDSLGDKIQTIRDRLKAISKT